MRLSKKVRKANSFRKRERRNMRINGKVAIASVLVSASAFLALNGTLAYADFGSGVAVLAEGTEIVKTAISGKKIVFSDLDFKQGLCITDFEKIKITSVPPSSEGTLLLAGRRVGAGTTIKRKNIGALVFIPASKDIAECKFKFTTDDFANGAEVDFIIKFTEKVNYAPTIVNSTEENLSLETQREISVYGRMRAEDKEGDALEYIVIKAPEHGSIKIINKESGEFLYTPPTGYVGEDCFSFVARDVWGNYSKPQTISVSIGERMCETVYSDMKTHPSYNAAVALTAMGIMDGRLIGDGVYFMPEKNVTVAEFVAMAMKSAGISPSEDTLTFFDDDADIPMPLKGYIATAQKMGIVTGDFADGKLLLRPTDNITRAEAAVVMANILDIDMSCELPTFNDASSVPVWARSSVSLLCYVGIFDSESETISADAPLTKADTASYLYKLAKNMEK